MVGVAGRSKGCVTCRKRRVKCDETHPTCERCRKAGRTCGGYVQNNFVDGLPGKVRKQRQDGKKAAAAAAAAAAAVEAVETASSSAEQALAVRSTPPRTSPPTDEGTRVEGDATGNMDVRWSQDGEAQALVVMDSSSPSLFSNDSGWRVFDGATSSSDSPPSDILDYMPAELDLTGFQDAIFVSYTAENMLKGVGSISGPRALQLPLTDGALAYICVARSSTAYFGYRHHESDIIQLGARRYASALRDLNAALADPKMSRSLMVLEAVVAMTLFEFVNPTSLEAWVTHALGIERLLVHRGPHAHIHGEAHIALNRIRPTIVYACLAAEKACELVTPEWCTVPWSAAPGGKPLEQLLMDVIGRLGPLMHFSTSYFRNPMPSLEQRDLLRALNPQFRAVLRDLDRWWTMFETKHASDFWEVPAAFEDLDPASTPTLWSTIFHFRNIFIANDFGTYHASSVLCNGIVRAVDSLEPNASPVLLRGLARQARHSAVEICRAVDYHLLPQHDGSGSIFLMFPLRMAWTALGGDTNEGRWLKDVVLNIGQGRRGGWAALPDMLFGDHRIRDGELGVRKEMSEWVD